MPRPYYPQQQPKGIKYMLRYTTTNLTVTYQHLTINQCRTQYSDFLRDCPMLPKTQASGLQTRRDVWSVQGASDSLRQRRFRDEFNQSSPRTAGKPQGLTVQSRAPETKKPTAVQGEKAGHTRAGNALWVKASSVTWEAMPFSLWKVNQLSYSLSGRQGCTK